MFHKEGFKIIVISTLIIGIGVLTIDYFVQVKWLNSSLIFILLFLYIIVLQFFRNPKRTVVINENHIIAPVDGKVVVIEEVDTDNWGIGGETVTNIRKQQTPK